MACCRKKAAVVVEVDAPDGTKGLKWFALASVEDVYKHALSTAKGITDEEAGARKQRFGPNKMTQGKKKTLLERTWDQINNALIWVLIAAAIVEAGFQSWPDTILIALVVSGRGRT